MAAIDFKILDNIYPLLDSVDVTVSSQDPRFPGSNLQQEFRSSVWRTKGNYEITASNNSLDFDEGSGELNAVIPVGTYSLVELQDEIKAQMEAVGAGTYTVTRGPGTGIWTISKSSGTFSLLFSTGLFSGSSIATTIGFLASDYVAAASQVGTKIALHTSEWALFDLQTAEEVDLVAFMPHSLDGIKLSNTAILKVQASATTDFSAPPVDQVLTISDDFELAIHVFTSPYPEYRYWRFLIIDPENANLYVEVGKFIFGKSTVVGRAPDIGFSNEFRDLSKKFQTDSGHTFSDIYPIKKVFNFNYGFMDYLDTVEIQKIYRRCGSFKRVALLLDSGEQLYSKDDMFIYGTFGESVIFTNMLRDIFTLPLTLEESF